VTLIAEILGVLLGGGAIASLARTERSRWRTRSQGVLIVVVAVASLIFCEGGWNLIRPMPAATRADAAIPKHTAEYPMAPAVNTAFLDWVRRVMLAGHGPETFWLAPTSAQADALTYQWSTYQLLPAREVDATSANWIVIYNAAPATVPYDHAAFPRVISFSPTFALAERHAG
jgi:hypothetical protein